MVGANPSRRVAMERGNVKVGTIGELGVRAATSW